MGIFTVTFTKLCKYECDVQADSIEGAEAAFRANKFIDGPTHLDTLDWNIKSINQVIPEDQSDGSQGTNARANL